MVIEIINQASGSLPQHPSDPLHIAPLSQYVNAVGNYVFEYASPTGNEDSSINSVRVGDLVYLSSAGRIKKVKKQTSNATLKKSKVFPVLFIKDNDENWFLEKDFTASEGFIGCIHSNEVELFADKLFIHDENSTSADQRIPFNYAVHCATGACLEGLVEIISFKTVDLIGTNSIPAHIRFK